MAANARGAAAINPPPDLPHDPSVSNALSNYLSRLSLWANQNFNNTVTKKSAVPELLLTDPTGATVWKLTVSSTGVLTTTQLTPGGAP